MAKTTIIEITKSSGNVFADIGLPQSEPYLVKAKIAYQINKLIQKKGLTQQQAAELLAIDQPKISALNRGRLSGFSIERLFKFLGILNQDVEIIIRPHKRYKGTAKKYRFPYIRVRYAQA